jgi:hypothetical protein
MAVRLAIEINVTPKNVSILMDGIDLTEETLS